MWANVNKTSQCTEQLLEICAALSTNAQSINWVLMGRILDTAKKDRINALQTGFVDVNHCQQIHNNALNVGWKYLGHCQTQTKSMHWTFFGRINGTVNTDTVNALNRDRGDLGHCQQIQNTCNEHWIARRWGGGVNQYTLNELTSDWEDVCALSTKRNQCSDYWFEGFGALSKNWQIQWPKHTWGIRGVVNKDKPMPWILNGRMCMHFNKDKTNAPNIESEDLVHCQQRQNRWRYQCLGQCWALSAQIKSMN